MDSIFPLLSQYWNVTMVLCSFIILLVLYRQIRDMEISHEESNKKHTYEFLENWARMNNEYYNELTTLEKYGAKESIETIHTDFKRMLEIKYNLTMASTFELKSNNEHYLSYISDPELKKFILDPFEWFKPYYFKAIKFFTDSSYSNGLHGSQILFPPVRNLENRIINEIDPNLHFRFDSIHKDYEKLLYSKNKKTKQIRAIILSIIVLIFSLFLIFISLNPLEIVLYSGLGFIAIYALYKTKL